MSLVRQLRRALMQAAEPIEGETHVYPGPSEYPSASSGMTTTRFVVRVVLGEDIEEVREQLDGLLDAADECSVKRRLEVDDTLGGLAMDVSVSKSSGYKLYPAEAGPQLGAEWTVEVIAEGAR